MFRRLSIVVVLILSIVFAGSAVADSKFFPESGSLSVEEATEWELERRQAQDGFERIAELSYFGSANHVPGNVYTVESGLIYDSSGEVVSTTEYDDGSYTLMYTLDFMDEDGTIHVTEDESTYTVRPGDGWWVISKRMDIPMDTLIDINDDTPLHPGVILTATDYGRSLTVTDPESGKVETFDDLPTYDGGDDTVSTAPTVPSAVDEEEPAVATDEEEEEEPTTVPAPAPASDGSFESSMLAMVNDARAEYGLAPYAASSTLNALASGWSETMAYNESMEHSTSFGPDILNSGAVAAGENVAMHYPARETTQAIASKLFNQWMNSPSHRAAILDPDYTHMGSGYAINNANEAYGTQHFGTY